MELSLFQPVFYQEIQIPTPDSKQRKWSPSSTSHGNFWSLFLWKSQTPRNIAYSAVLGYSAQQPCGFCTIYNVVLLSCFWLQTFFFFWDDCILECSSFKVFFCHCYVFGAEGCAEVGRFLERCLRVLWSRATEMISGICTWEPGRWHMGVKGGPWVDPGIWAVGTNGEPASCCSGI